MKKEKLLLIDANALLYRAHFALMRSPRFNKQGMNTSALFGFTNTLISLYQKEKPTHIAVALDPKGDTWRSEVYEEYKANRQAQPEDITAATTYLPKLLEAFQIPLILKKGFEADDVIGTFAQKATKEGMEVYMVTPDKDFAQLVDTHIHWYKPGIGGKKDEILRIPEVCAQWNVKEPKQVQDILGLWGDASDNIPGVPGIGEKGAKKLIAAFGSIEGILENLDQLSPKQQTLFKEYKEQALLSKRLATISTDVKIDLKLKETLHQGIDPKKIKALFAELDFRTLVNRLFQPKKTSIQLGLFGDSASEHDMVEIADDYDTLSKVPHDYTCVDSLEACKKLVKKLSQQKRLALDTETSGLEPRHATLLGISFAYKKQEAYYIPFGEDHSSLDRKQVLKLLKPVLQDPKIEKIGQNLKYDMHVLRCHGVPLQGPLFDTMVAHHLLYPDGRHGLNVMAETYLQYRPIPIESLLGPRGKKQKKITDVPLEQLVDYACEDADVTWQLYEKFVVELKKENLYTLFREVEMPLLPVLVAMEATGVTIDIPALEASSQLLQKEVDTLTKNIFQLAGSEFNVDSPKQLGEVLFEKLQIVDNPTKTKTGQYATNEGILSKLQGKHPIIQDIREYRELKKLKSTYIDALPELMDPVDGRVHTSYQQSIVSTGRLSSTKPNLQNIPIRTDRGRAIRKAFVPSREDGYLLAADYSQIELRIMAHLSEDKNLIATFEAGEDVHTATAAKLFAVPKEKVSDAQRRKAKMTNFSIIYGITPFGLSQRLEVSRTEAKNIIDSYFASFPGVKKYIDTSIEKAREKGWVSTVLGRKRLLPDINSRNATVRGFAERNAINMPIQGTQAEMIKKAMVAIYAWMEKEKLQSKMIMQVHDELVFDVHPGEVTLLQEKLPLLMEKALTLKLPVVVEVGVGKNWLEAH
ncbi:MAG: DNA polymerase I [Bacteroidota bacterium]